jgi:hypothetical protein
LFEGEHIPDDPTAYLDQRYIDYLAKNSEEMGRIHWRNFERLTTEFFRRLGYELDLGYRDKGRGHRRESLDGQGFKNWTATNAHSV